MIYRVYVEKKPGLAPEASSLLTECCDFLGIDKIKEIRVLNRYDVENISAELFQRARSTVFSEPQLDLVYEDAPLDDADHVFAVEPLPGQFDQRADSAAQCIQLLQPGDRPIVRTARVYALYGELTNIEVDRIKRFVINPVESREASLEKPETLRISYPVPTDIEIVDGFIAMDRTALSALLDRLGLAMDLDDLAFLQAYFRDTEKRDPTLTEIRVVDTYWSDHCRHTTFSTHIDSVELLDKRVKDAFERYLKARIEVYGEEKASHRPITLMDLATIGAKTLKKRGLLPELDESEEINACSIRVPVKVDGEQQDWLLMFKNETHNHPTEIEPFGGAATCIGGCIRDPLSGRAYVHQAMRVTGGGDPRKTLAETLEGKLPQRKLAQTAAAGYSSYGNQIGLATGHVAEVYHEGYVAKRLECGAVVAAAPVENVRRERPAPGDIVILLGGRTGRDGIGGATGSSKSHNKKSLSTMASEVQKGNAPEERKIQRLFRDGNVTRLIKRCNDFGAGGVSVAIGELADGLEIELDAVRKKYDGLDGTELAISESQERMAVVVSPEDAQSFIAAAARENLEAYPVAVVTEKARMVMHWRGKIIADLSRDFLNTNGAVKHSRVSVPASPHRQCGSQNSLREMASSLQSASRRGLVERFDSSIGAGSILVPYGGRTQRSPAQAMAALFPILPGQHSEDASVMAWGFDPDRMAEDCYGGAHDSVYLSMAKLVAAGGDYQRAYLSFQEFFEKLRDEPARWGKPFSALLGALDAQLELGAAAIGGKDSMSGSFLDRDVPPTLISFAIAPAKASEILSTEFKSAEHPVYLFSGNDPEGCKAAWDRFEELHRSGLIRAAWAVEHGLAEAVMNMGFGNEIGFSAEPGVELDWFSGIPGAIVAELAEAIEGVQRIGTTTALPVVNLEGESVSLSELLAMNESVLESVYPTSISCSSEKPPCFTYHAETHYSPAVNHARPTAVIPVFPGTNCEYDTARAWMEAGGEAKIVVVRNLNAHDVAESVERFSQALRSAQTVLIPGGFSGGDEPDGSAKFITAFFRNPSVKEEVEALLQKRDGLMLGICNGFQALIKLGLVPYGRILDTDEHCPTLSYNTIGRHQAKLVRTRVCSDLSPWLSGTKPGDIFTVPISHGEGRFLAEPSMIKDLALRGQIVTQYVDLDGCPSMDTSFNPNGSLCAVEGICSPDGRVLGKMGHSERVGKNLYRNVPGETEMKLFCSAINYFK